MIDSDCLKITKMVYALKNRAKDFDSEFNSFGKLYKKKNIIVAIEEIKETFPGKLERHLGWEKYEILEQREIELPEKKPVLRAVYSPFLKAFIGVESRDNNADKQRFFSLGLDGKVNELRELKLAPFFWEMIASPDGKRLYIAHHKFISVVDLTRGFKVVDKFKVFEEGDQYGIYNLRIVEGKIYAKLTSRYYSASTGCETHMISVDINGKNLETLDVPLGEHQEFDIITKGGKNIFVMSWLSYDRDLRKHCTRLDLFDGAEKIRDIRMEFDTDNFQFMPEGQVILAMKKPNQFRNDDNIMHIVDARTGRDLRRIGALPAYDYRGELRMKTYRPTFTLLSDYSLLVFAPSRTGCTLTRIGKPGK